MDHIKAYIPDAIWYDFDTVSKVASMISETFEDNSNTEVLGVHGDISQVFTMSWLWVCFEAS